MKLPKRLNALLILACSTIFLGTIVLNAGEHYSSMRLEQKGEGKLSPSLQVTEKTEKTFSPSVKEVEEKDTRGNRVRVWVLAGSMGRSGTSVVGQLMAQETPSMYFFEPELFIQVSSGTMVTEERGMPFLREVFECRFSEPFVKWLYTRSKSNIVRHPMTRHCKSAAACFTVDSLSHHCLQEELRIIKVIRYRIRWMRELLSDSNFDVKLVHIIRDPRASLRSVRANLHFFVDKLYPEYVCPLIEDDLAQIQEFQEKFPGRAMRLEYEKFCLDPEGEATKLWRFLSNDSDAHLPPSWLRFLETHTQKKREGKKYPVFGTVRNTREEYEAWRWEIDEGLLTMTEKYCSSVISVLGHRLLRSLSVARNASVPLVTA